MNLTELFGTYNNGRKIITAKVKSYAMYTKFNDELLENLLRNHPTKKITDIEYLIIKPHEIFRSRTLYFKKPNSYEDNISYKLCIQNVFGQYNSLNNKKANKISCFRNAISNTKRKIFQSNLKSKCCEQCGEYTEKPHIDHYKISFKQILDQFLYHYDLKIENIETYYEKSQHHISDKSLKEEFIEYHDELVIYKLLCADCNSSNGTYGY
jgi:hypothetical protein